MAKKKSRKTPARTPQQPAQKQTPVRKQAPATRKTASRQATQKTAAASSRWEPAGWLRYALIAMAVTFAVYIPSLQNELVNWDDDPNITENPNLVVIDAESIGNIFSIDKGAVIGNYNPLPIFTFALEKLATGEFNTTLIHFDNLLLHVLTVFFVFRLLLHMGIGLGGSLLGGLLFGIHPMRVESVAWATERKDVLFAVFFFAALMYYIRWIKTEDRGKQTTQYILMIVLAVLSGFSKVQAVTLPLSMLALDLWFRRDISLKLIWEKTPFWIISMIFGLINLYTLRQQGSTVDEVTNFGLADRLCIGAWSFLVYLYKLVIPYPMSPLYPYPKPLPIWVYISPIGFFAVWYLIWRAWQKDNRIWVVGMLFFFFNVMFLLQVLGAGQGYLADRFTYVPYFGFFAIAAYFYDKYAENADLRRNLNIGLGVLMVIYAVISFRQIKVWENGETLWTHVIKFEGKTNSLPYWNRGQYYRGLGKFDLSLQDYSSAISINPKNPELFNSRGKTYFDMAMSEQFRNQSAEYTQKAIDDYTDGLALPTVKDKSKAEMLINRGAAKASQGRYQEALQDLNAGLEVDPGNKNGYFNRSLVNYSTGQYEAAISDYTEYLKFDPYNANVWYERGMLRRALKKGQDAVTDLDRAIQLNPNLGIAYLERARAKIQVGDKASALQDYQRAQQMGIQLSEKDREYMQ